MKYYIQNVKAGDQSHEIYGMVNKGDVPANAKEISVEEYNKFMDERMTTMSKEVDKMNAEADKDNNGKGYGN